VPISPLPLSRRVATLCCTAGAIAIVGYASRRGASTVLQASHTTASGAAHSVLCTCSSEHTTQATFTTAARSHHHLHLSSLLPLEMQAVSVTAARASRTRLKVASAQCQLAPSRIPLAATSTLHLLLVQLHRAATRCRLVPRVPAAQLYPS
ncbi:hypothetical protein JKP88DRAFT_328332, partial [Tribonema minus]